MDDFLEQREEREDPVAKHFDTTLLAIHTFTSFESKNLQRDFIFSET